MNTNQEPRETFTRYITNERPIYDRIHAAGLLVAADIRAAIEAVNRAHEPETAGTPLISTDADKRQAVAAYLDELSEVITWELIG